MPLACSTCWNSHRHSDGAEMLLELWEMGFRLIELSHGLRVTQLEGILQFLMRHPDIKVCSVHHPCPMPIEIQTDAPDLFEFTSHRPEDVRRAVRLAKETIELAHRLKAPAMVLHLGSIPHGGWQKELEMAAQEGALLDRKNLRKKVAALKRRAEAAPRYWERVWSCLDVLVPYAKEKGVRIGIECRARARELPLEPEFDAIWRRYPEGTVGYWHDFGHMQRKHNLGLGDHWEALSQQSSRIIGAHLHDTIWPARDHRPPGCSGGTVEWNRLLPLLPSAIPKVLELEGRVSAESVRAAREWLVQHLAEGAA
jgi:sugar phosphate isomerase/epimerase